MQIIVNKDRHDVVAYLSGGGREWVVVVDPKDSEHPFYVYELGVHPTWQYRAAFELRSDAINLAHAKYTMWVEVEK